MKKPQKLSPVIPAPQELVEKMRKLSEMPPVSLEAMRAQVRASLGQRFAGVKSSSGSASGRKRRAA